MNIDNISRAAAIGGWVIVSLFFMGQASGYISSKHDTTVDQLVRSSTEMNANLVEHRIRQETLISRLTVALRVLCENSARTTPEYNNCKNIQQ